MGWPGVCADTIKPIHDKSDFINVKLILKKSPIRLNESKNIAELSALVGCMQFFELTKSPHAAHKNFAVLVEGHKTEQVL